MLRLLLGPSAGTRRNLHSRGHAGTPRVCSRCGLWHETGRSWHYRNPGNVLLRNPGLVICSPPLLSPDAARPWACAWPPPLQRQLAEIRHRRDSIVSWRTTGTKSENSDRTFHRGLRTGDAADIASSRNGQHLSAKSLHHRWKHEIQIALLQRRAAMARAVLPNPLQRRSGSSQA